MLYYISAPILYMTSDNDKKLGLIMTNAYSDYGKGMGAFANFKIHDKAISQDLVQDTFMKTWKYLVKNGKIDVMKSFLYHVLNNLIIDEYRKRKATSLDELLEKGYEPSIDNTDRLLNVLDGKAAILLIQRLPEKYQVVMKMRFIKMLSLKEISLITGQSKNTIAVQIHRGTEMLKILYNQKSYLGA